MHSMTLCLLLFSLLTGCQSVRLHLHHKTLLHEISVAVELQGDEHETENRLP